LSRRDGLTIGALITAVGMIISTVFLAVMLTTTTTADTPAQPNEKTFAQKVKKKQLVKITNWFLDLAKKALALLPGLLGELIRFIFKKAGKLVLFFSQHLIIFFLAVIVFVVEITWNKMLKKK